MKAVEALQARVSRLEEIVSSCGKTPVENASSFAADVVQLTQRLEQIRDKGCCSMSETAAVQLTLYSARLLARLESFEQQLIDTAESANNLMLMTVSQRPRRQVAPCCEESRGSAVERERDAEEKLARVRGIIAQFLKVDSLLMSGHADTEFCAAVESQLASLFEAGQQPRTSFVRSPPVGEQIAEARSQVEAFANIIRRMADPSTVQSRPPCEVKGGGRSRFRGDISEEASHDVECISKATTASFADHTKDDEPQNVTSWSQSACALPPPSGELPDVCLGLSTHALSEYETWEGSTEFCAFPNPMPHPKSTCAMPKPLSDDSSDTSDLPMLSKASVISVDPNFDDMDEAVPGPGLLRSHSLAAALPNNEPVVLGANLRSTLQRISQETPMPGGILKHVHFQRSCVRQHRKPSELDPTPSTGDSCQVSNTLWSSFPTVGHGTACQWACVRDCDVCVVGETDLKSPIFSSRNGPAVPHVHRCKLAEAPWEIAAVMSTSEDTPFPGTGIIDL